MTSIPRQLGAHIVTSSQWTALTDLETGDAYSPPPGGRAVASGFRVISLSPEDNTIEVAVSPTTGVSSSAEMLIPSIYMATGDHIRIPDVVVIPEGFCMWARVVSSDPMVTVTAAILETVP